jgi:hypothetical protein
VALLGEAIDHAEHTEPSACGSYIAGKINRPLLARAQSRSALAAKSE